MAHRIVLDVAWRRTDGPAASSPPPVVIEEDDEQDEWHAWVEMELSQ
jgi:hypothetical protein